MYTARCKGRLSCYTGILPCMPPPSHAFPLATHASLLPRMPPPGVPPCHAHHPVTQGPRPRTPPATHSPAPPPHTTPSPCEQNHRHLLKHNFRAGDNYGGSWRRKGEMLIGPLRAHQILFTLLVNFSHYWFSSILFFQGHGIHAELSWRHETLPSRNWWRHKTE